MRGIVDKHHPVEVALGCWSGELALEVSVDQGKANELPGGKSRDRVAIQLPSKTRLADGVRLTLGADDKALDKAFADGSAQIVEIDVGTALVPKGELLIAGGGGRERSF